LIQLASLSFGSIALVILPYAGFFALFTCLSYSLLPCLEFALFSKETFSIPTKLTVVFLNV